MGQETPGPSMQQMQHSLQTGPVLPSSVLQCCSHQFSLFGSRARLQPAAYRIQSAASVPHLNKHFLITTEFFNLIILTVSTRNILGTNKHRLSDADGSGRTSLKSLIILLSPDPDNKKEQPVLGNVNTKSLPHTGDRARRLLHRPDTISHTPRDTDDHNKSKYKMTSVPL